MAAARKVCTLVLLSERRGGRRHVLLGMKKRGFGEGKWNGFGGKVEAGESVSAAAARELEEEAGVRARALEKRGVIWFDWPADERAEDAAHVMVRRGIEVHVFAAEQGYDGEVTESDEMRPRWFDEADIPFDSMWADDRHWFPNFFAGELFAAYFLFSGTDAFLASRIVAPLDAAALDGEAAPREVLERAAGEATAAAAV